MVLRNRWMAWVLVCVGAAILPVRGQDRVVRDRIEAGKSSWIEDAWFEKEAGSSAGRLTVKMGDEEITYIDVPVTVWLEFKNAESIGSFYGQNIKTRYERIQGEPLSARHDSPVMPPSDAKVQCAFNEECEPIILSHIDLARTRIHVAAYAFTRTKIAAALVGAKVRGVDVRMKVDSRQAEYPSAARALAYLEKNGVPVTRITVQGDYAAMHNKFLVIDDRYVIAGSYNFTTTAGAANWENILLVDSPDIAAFYEKAWQAITAE